jgi:hypothetical protein
MPRVSIFGTGEKDKTDNRLWVRGNMTREGMREFNRARKALGELFRRISGRDPAAVSDADTAEFLARGVEDSTAFIIRKWGK